MSNQKSAEYKCSQNDLYEVCRVGWSNFKKFETEFHNLKRYYTNAFADFALSQIEIAKAMPDATTYVDAREKNRIILEMKADVCKKNFGKLKLYINTAYPEEMTVMMHDEAGLRFYKEAVDQNWEAVNQMNICMKKFMAVHFQKIKLNTNVPLSFETYAENCINDFSLALEKYRNEMKALVSNKMKIRANNHLYRKLSLMFIDAKKIFGRYPELMWLFDFDKIMQSINSPAAKIRGLVTDEMNTAINTAIIKIKYPDEPEIILVVDEDGSFDTGSIKGGNALITVEADGFAKIKETMNIPKGAIVNKNLMLLKGAA